MLDKDSPLAGWLYRVAYHLALRLRGATARQRGREREAAQSRALSVSGDGVTEIEKNEIRAALRDELERLPEKYRGPLVLHYFAGQTHEEAARTLGVPRGSMAKRIGEGLERLRDRLTDRGFTL
jgi:RNA polymerase sigma factor (sigma-70 family)